ncbi:hypothetical protein GIB67_015974 [Kingdonia uniflora]|uniref:F-box domain-containing protein n=1 Tax=Kingdonia uniflora TaxID=39325 RepID=A0A7J7PCF3_9MAGN|nr:hypothetical protein GIB67_015974 [Kingdonia uniflora]
MANWSNLPRDLLDHISKLLNFDTDILRFRSVCSSWRLSVSSPSNRLPNRVTIKPKPDTTRFPDKGAFYLSKRGIYRLSLPEDHPEKASSGSSYNGWLVKVDQDFPGVFRLLNPLSENPIDLLATPFGKNLNLMNFRIDELGKEYVLRYFGEPPCAYAGDVYLEKVVFSMTPPWGGSNGDDDGDCVIMTIHVSGKIAIFRFRDNSWTVINDLQYPFDDLIVYKETFYAVDYTGRIVVVNADLTLTEISTSVLSGESGDTKVLVELDGELLMVDRYLNLGSNVDSSTHDEAGYTTTLFTVYKFNEANKTWDEVKNLGDDRLLFVGDNCTFSASTCDFSGFQRNSIYFKDKHTSREDCISVFHLEDGSVGPYMTYNQLCSPPPSWFSSPAL